MKLFKNFRNRLKYKKYTSEVFKFTRENYTLEIKDIQGPIIDSRQSKEETTELFYLVEFKKECPENKITLRINLETKKVSEVERL